MSRVVFGLAASPWLAVAATLIASLVAWRVPAARSPARFVWFAIWQWVAPLFALATLIAVFFKVMFAFGECIGTPWLMMLPAIVLAPAFGIAIFGLLVWLGYQPIKRAARGLGANNSSKPTPLRGAA